MPVRHILFDADGVIQNWRPSAVNEIRALLSKADDFQPFLQDVLAAEGPCLRGEGDFTQALQQVLNKWQIAIPATQVVQHWESIDVYPGVIQLIKTFARRGIRCHLATNQQHLRAAYMRRHMGYDDLFDQSFYSCDLGVAKPDPLYFSAILGKLRALPENTLFIDDRKENTEAALSVGLQVLQFDARSTVSGSRGQPETELARALSKYEISSNS